MTVVLFIEITVAILLLVACTKVIKLTRRAQCILRNINNQHTDMATFTELQQAAADNTTAAQTLETAITAYVAAQAGSITATQADEVVASIQASTASLTAATTALTGA